MHRGFIMLLFYRKSCRFRKVQFQFRLNYQNIFQPDLSKQEVPKNKIICFLLLKCIQQQKSPPLGFGRQSLLLSTFGWRRWAPTVIGGGYHLERAGLQGAAGLSGGTQKASHDGSEWWKMLVLNRRKEQDTARAEKSKQEAFKPCHIITKKKIFINKGQTAPLILLTETE